MVAARYDEALPTRLRLEGPPPLLGRKASIRRGWPARVHVAANLTSAERDQASFQRVPLLSVQPAICGPKPIEKASALTPNQRPTKKAELVHEDQRLR